MGHTLSPPWPAAKHPLRISPLRKYRQKHPTRLFYTVPVPTYPAPFKNHINPADNPKNGTQNTIFRPPLGTRAGHLRAPMTVNIYYGVTVGQIFLNFLRHPFLFRHLAGHVCFQPAKQRPRILFLPTGAVSSKRLLSIVRFSVLPNRRGRVQRTTVTSLSIRFLINGILSTQQEPHTNCRMPSNRPITCTKIFIYKRKEYEKQK